jgi:hypothetical protein
MIRAKYVDLAIAVATEFHPIGVGPRLHVGCSFHASSRCAPVHANSPGCRNCMRRNLSRAAYNGASQCIRAKGAALRCLADSALRNDGVGGSNPSCAPVKSTSYRSKPRRTIVARCAIGALDARPGLETLAGGAPTSGWSQARSLVGFGLLQKPAGRCPRGQDRRHRGLQGRPPGERSHLSATDACGECLGRRWRHHRTVT